MSLSNPLQGRTYRKHHCSPAFPPVTLDTPWAWQERESFLRRVLAVTDVTDAKATLGVTRNVSHRKGLDLRGRGESPRAPGQPAGFLCPYPSLPPSELRPGGRGQDARGQPRSGLPGPPPGLRRPPPSAPLPAPSERSPRFQEEPAQQSRGARCSSNRRQRLVTKEVLLCTQIPPGKRMEVAIWLRLASQSSTHTQAELPRSHFHDNHMKC